MQLFLLPFAGGNIYSYDFLKKKINNTNIEIYSLELPGRGKRQKEPLIRNKKSAIQDYGMQIKKRRNGKPFIIYGHSLGATLGLSVVKFLEESGDIPSLFMASGNPGPGIKREDERMRHLLPDVDFKNVLIELGGISEEILEDKELFNFINPILRADFEVLETDLEGLEKNMKINTPINVMMGDKEKTSKDINNWELYTNKPVTTQILKGDHFFIYDHIEVLVNIILANYQQSQNKYTF